jgi:hypothetical protein
MSQVVTYSSVPLNWCSSVPLNWCNWPCQIEVHSSLIEMHLSRHRARVRLCRCRCERVCSLIQRLPTVCLHFNQPGGHACGMSCVKQLDHICDKLTRGIPIEIKREIRASRVIQVSE